MKLDVGTFSFKISFICLASNNWKELRCTGLSFEPYQEKAEYFEPKKKFPLSKKGFFLGPRNDFETKRKNRMPYEVEKHFEHQTLLAAGLKCNFLLLKVDCFVFTEMQMTHKHYQKSRKTLEKRIAWFFNSHSSNYLR